MAKKRKLGDISQSSELLIEPIWDQKHLKKNRLSHIHFNLKRRALIIGLTHFTYL